MKFYQNPDGISTDATFVAPPPRRWSSSRPFVLTGGLRRASCSQRVYVNQHLRTWIWAHEDGISSTSAQAASGPCFGRWHARGSSITRYLGALGGPPTGPDQLGEDDVRYEGAVVVNSSEEPVLLHEPPEVIPALRGQACEFLQVPRALLPRFTPHLSHGESLLLLGCSTQRIHQSSALRLASAPLLRKREMRLADSYRRRSWLNLASPYFEW